MHLGKKHGSFISFHVRFISSKKCLLPHFRHTFPQSQRSIHTLKKVVANVAQHNNRSVPSFLLSLILYFIEGKVADLVGKDIFAIDFLMYLNLVELPALFIYSTNDAVVSEANVKQLFDSYRGSKKMIGMQCLHHQDRPPSAIREAFDFILT